MCALYIWLAGAVGVFIGLMLAALLIRHWPK